MRLNQFFPMAAACAATLGAIAGASAAAATSAPPAVTALVGGTVVAVDGGPAIDNATVLVTGERISQVGPAESTTTQAARMLAMDADVGSVSVGKFADIIAVSADPVKDIHALRTIDFVMKGGAVVRDDRREIAAY